MQTKDHVKDCFIFNKIEEESVGNDYKMSNTQISMQMNCPVASQNNQLQLPQHNIVQNHLSTITNGNMMNINNQYHFFTPNNMFACPMIPIGYNPFNQINCSNPEGNQNLHQFMN